MSDESEPHRFTGYLVRRAQQAHVLAWTREVPGEITSVQYGVLAVLHASPGASQRDLGRDLDLDRSTVADVVARLERRELIARQRDAQDRRRNRLHLTPSGESELARLRPHVEDVERVLIARLNGTERTELRGLLNKLLGAPDREDY